MNWFQSFWKALTTSQPHGKPAPADAQNNFTPRAQQVLGLARKEAQRFHHNFVGTEHLLLGLISLGQDTAAVVLGKLGLNLETVRLEVESQVGTGPDQTGWGNIPFTPRVKKVLALAMKEAKELNHTYIGTEHILLGLLHEGDGVAARVLQHFGVDIEKARLEILKELDPNLGATAMTTKPSQTPPNALSLNPQPDPVDTTKRYDVYCAERNQAIVVYRNALFKGTKKLFPQPPRDIFSDFLELEQADGQTVFVARSSVIKFCEHGAAPKADTALPDRRSDLRSLPWHRNAWRKTGGFRCATPRNPVCCKFSTVQEASSCAKLHYS